MAPGNRGTVFLLLRNEAAARKGAMGALNPKTLPACCRALLGSHVHLRSSSLLALTKLMAIDPDFCDANLALIFTLLEKRQVRLPAALLYFFACCLCMHRLAWAGEAASHVACFESHCWIAPVLLVHA